MTSGGDNMQEIMRALGRLEGKVDSMVSSLHGAVDRMNRIDQDIEDLDKRLRDVEKKQYGIFAVATVVWGIIVLVSKWFKIL